MPRLVTYKCDICGEIIPDNEVVVYAMPRNVEQIVEPPVIAPPEEEELPELEPEGEIEEGESGFVPEEGEETEEPIEPEIPTEPEPETPIAPEEELEFIYVIETHDTYLCMNHRHAVADLTFSMRFSGELDKTLKPITVTAPNLNNLYSETYNIVSLENGRFGVDLGELTSAPIED